MSTPQSIATPHLHLRTLRTSDAAALCTASNNLALDDLEPTRTPDEARLAIQTYANDFAAGTRLVYGVFRADTNELIGSGSITPTDARAVNIGIWLAAPARGAGFGAEIVEALTEVAVRLVGADRMELWCEPANTPMTRIAERLGYEYVTTLPRWSLRANGDRFDQSVYRLMASTWTRRENVRVVASAEERMSEADRVWASVTNHLRLLYSIAREEPMLCELVVEVTRTTGAEWQSVFVQQVYVLDQPWLILRAPVGDEALLSHSTALSHNAVLAAGALTIEDGMHVLRYGVPPNAITVDGIACLVTLLADEAVRLRASLRAPVNHHVTAFSAFAE